MHRFLTCALALCLFAAACKDDDNDIAVAAEDIVGAWQLTEYTSTSKTSGTSGGERFGAEVKIGLVSSTAVVTFAEDGTYDSRGSYTASTTTTLDGTTTDPIEQNVNVAGSAGRWEVRGGNRLVLTGASLSPDLTGGASIQASSAEYTITSFAADERLEIRTGIDSTFSQGGSTFRIEGDIRAVFTQ